MSAFKSPKAAEAVTALFKSHFGHTPPHVVMAPGRLELLGTRGDCDDGLSLTAAIDRHACLAAAPRTDGRIELVSSASPAPEKFWMSDVQPAGGNEWSRGIRAVLDALRGRGAHFCGFNAAFHTTLPPGMDLGGVAATLVATALMVRKLYPYSLTETGITLPPRRTERGVLPALSAPEKLHFARLCLTAEESWRNCGGRRADAMSSLFGRAWNVLNIDARFATVEQTPLPGEALIVCETGSSPPTNQDAEGETFRQLCASAAQKLRARSLRSVELPLLKANRAQLDEPEFRCASHVVGETARVVAAEQVLREEDHRQLGQFMLQSHESWRTVCGGLPEETELLVTLAQRHPGCLGARAIQGGTVNLVAYHQAEGFLRDLVREYESLLGAKLNVSVCQMVDGAA